MSDKQAVILIHGIGEQRPMETLRGFVNTVWTLDEKLHHQHAIGGLWSKPDEVSESFELRRLTTSKSRSGLRTDFFEFYWAHMIQGTTLGNVWSWAHLLLFRCPWSVPRPLFGVWLLLLVALTITGVFALNAVLPEEQRLIEIPVWISAAISVAVIPVVDRILRKVVGDAARYLDAAPPNIQVRHKIRSAGVTLLRRLHEREYERIIVVGHSLGSVIGYDILTHAWAEFHDQRQPRTNLDDDALERLESIAAAEGFDVAGFREAQWEYAKELRRHGNRWRVTDFVTLGSPLAHGAVLLARNVIDLRNKQSDRELPTCPPVLETERKDGQEHKRFSFAKPVREKQGGRHSIRVPHHAAVFAPVRWTNLYFPARFVFCGDLIGGPLAPVFGMGVYDVSVRTGQRVGLLSHTLYWRLPKGVKTASHVDELRKAVRLAG